MDWLFTYSYSLENSIFILMALTLVTVFLVNKTRIEPLIFLTVYYLFLFINIKLFHTITCGLLFMLLISEKSIKTNEPKFELGALALLIVSCLNIYYELFNYFNLSMLRYAQSIILLYLIVILFSKTHKNYTIAGILLVYNITMSSYAVLWSPIVAWALQLQCLSLALFLMHYVRTDFKGSIVHYIYCRLSHKKEDIYKTKFSSNILIGLRGGVY